MNFLQTAEAKGQAAIAWCETELVHLKTEGEVLLAWVEKEVPSAKGAIAIFLQEAEADAAVLARASANGLGAKIGAAGDEVQTLLLNVIQATHLNSNAQSALKEIDVSGVALLSGIGKALISTGLATILSKLAPALGPTQS